MNYSQLVAAEEKWLTLLPASSAVWGSFLQRGGFEKLSYVPVIVMFFSLKLISIAQDLNRMPEVKNECNRQMKEKKDVDDDDFVNYETRTLQQEKSN